jgi:hypothetical protein
MERKVNLKEGNVSLVLDKYQDLFSDFDARPLQQKSLSVDFLEETKRAIIDKKGKLQMNLFMPKKLRNFKDETTIKKRLSEHFRRHKELENKEYKKLISKGIKFVTFGVIVMFLASLILFKYSEGSIFTSFLVVFLEPAGWFLFWEGLDLVIFDAKKMTKNRTFYNRMSEAEIVFSSY